MVKRRASKDTDYISVDYDDIRQFGRPRKTTNGIKAKTARGTFGESWWAKRWITTLENYGIGSRLQRGRSYARAGQVLDIQIEPGAVIAHVQGSMPKPYKVNIGLPRLTGAEWEKVIDAMSAQAIFAAKLLAGEMPDDIETAFETGGVSLFPTKVRDLHTSCSCPDSANPCKHIAAVYYLLGEQFDADPFLIFTLRGRTREQVIAALRQRRQTAPSATSGSNEIALPASTLPLSSNNLDNFWTAGNLEDINIQISPPQVSLAMLKRLGNPPEQTQRALEMIYVTMSKAALERAFGEDNPSSD